MKYSWLERYAYTRYEWTWICNGNNTCEPVLCESIYRSRREYLVNVLRHPRNQRPACVRVGFSFPVFTVKGRRAERREEAASGPPQSPRHSSLWGLPWNCRARHPPHRQSPGRGVAARNESHLIGISMLVCDCEFSSLLAGLSMM